jgi:hypothetical protein
LVRQPSGVRDQRLADDVEYLLSLEAVGVEEEFVGFVRLVGDLESRRILIAERLVLPSQRTRLRKADVHGLTDVHRFLRQNVRCGQVKAPERFEVARTDFE